MNKKLLTAIITLSLVTALAAGCGSSKTETEDASSKEAVTETQESEATPAPTIDPEELEEMENEFSMAISRLSSQISSEEYNSAALTWEEINETYGDVFADDIKKAEAELKDSGIDPDNIGNGMSDEAKEKKEKAERDYLYEVVSMYFSGAQSTGDYTEVTNMVNDALTKYPDDQGFLSLKESIEQAKAQN